MAGSRALGAIAIAGASTVPVYCWVPENGAFVPVELSVAAIVKS